MSTDENKDLVRRLVEILNGDRLGLLDDVVAEGYRQDNPSVPGGREGLRSLFARLAQRVP